jgi:hypothetical protein
MIIERIGIEGTRLGSEIPHTRTDLALIRLTFQPARCGYTLRVT